MVVQQNKWIYFWKQKRPFKKLTDNYIVHSKDGDVIIGTISWYSPFRKYSFFPNPNIVTVFEATCLKDISEFLVKLMEEHKEQKKIIDFAVGRTDEYKK